MSRPKKKGLYDNHILRFQPKTEREHYDAAFRIMRVNNERSMFQAIVYMGLSVQAVRNAHYSYYVRRNKGVDPLYITPLFRRERYYKTALKNGLCTELGYPIKKKGV